jgi:2-polyprenyl-3-methyl-5-hydroxy-6-metoxy-1,4-benzoquinol methylase
MGGMTTYELATCPVCRSPSSRVIADGAQIRKELEALWQFHLRRLHTGAPVAQLFDRAIFSQQPPLQVTQCRDCGTVYRNPRERDEQLVETYQEETPSQEALASLFSQQYDFYKKRVSRLTQLAGQPREVLEVGSYVGGFLRAARDAGWRARGIDVNPHANRFARAQGCEVEACALHELGTNQHFDAVVLWNCFDQLPDPHEALARVTAMLNPAGLVALRIPNGACYAALRGRGGLSRLLLAWNNLASFPYRHGFTSASLAQLLEHHGYAIVQQHADTLVPISSAYTRGWARREEQLVKRAMKALLPQRLAPWLEVYARLAIR